MTDNAQDDGQMFGPLNFESSIPPGNQHELECPLCEDTFSLELAFKIFVQHLFEVHKLVVDEIQHINNLPGYLKYWKDKFRQVPMEDILPPVRVRSSEDSEIYYLLSNLTKEDEELRRNLKLWHVVKIQEVERNAKDFKHVCLFCKENVEGTRQDFIRHWSTQHNLQLGNPDKLVHIEELIEKIEKELTALNCIYCKKNFPEWFVLKEHMRKKLHKRVKYNDKDYDRFYMVQYVEETNTATTNKNSPSEELSEELRELDLNPELENSDSEFNDWSEKGDAITCLFCSKSETDINVLCLHMEADHDFDFGAETKKFDFYQKVKFVNFARKQVHDRRCIVCEFKGENGAELERHLYREKHCRVPESEKFDKPEYFFPTYENDAFLYLIDDVED